MNNSTVPLLKIFMLALVILLYACTERIEENTPEYMGEDLKTIQFPVGGIGTGNINIGGRGNIAGLEIFNIASKNRVPKAFFCLWVFDENNHSETRILEREFSPPFPGGFGVPRNQVPGMARFDEVLFRGEYPFAWIDFMDEDIPLDIRMEAWNPFIPLDSENSGIPVAMINWEFANPGNSPVHFSIALNMENPVRSRNEEDELVPGGNTNQYISRNGVQGIWMSSERNREDDLEFGNIALLTTEDEVDIQTRWYQGGWWDNLHVFLNDFSDDGRISNHRDDVVSGRRKSEYATLLIHKSLEPGQSCIVPFYISWFFPNRTVTGNRVVNHYATRFSNAFDVALHTEKNKKELRKHTEEFHDLLFSSTYPACVIDAVSSQMSSLKTNLVLRNDQGYFYGFEGLGDDFGCCPGSCTHVWNYEQTLAFLFPSMERSMREISFLHDTHENGYQTFRTIFPPGNGWQHHHPAADGMLGNIVQVYRDWKLTGDMQWLKKMWPSVMKAMEFAWKGVGETGTDKEWMKQGQPLPWDPGKDGVIEGMQHNTYDIQFYGPNTLVGSIYLAALKASSEMAMAMGFRDKAMEYMNLFRNGSVRYDTMLFNGRYYVQQVQVMDGLELPEHLISPEPGKTMPKYQYGKGCLSDQLLGQYLAFINDLEYLLEKEHVDSALLAIYRNNFIRSLDEFNNVQRVFALGNEGGLVLCTWPEGDRPAIPFPYSDEVWTGIEYQVAASLIYSGYIDEGLEIVQTLRERYRGYNRNPWDEIECGHHYARAMASWAVLLALSGYHYDGTMQVMKFRPCINTGDFASFWSNGTGWGGFKIRNNSVDLSISFGHLRLKELHVLTEDDFEGIHSVTLNGEQELAAGFQQDGRLDKIVFQEFLEFQEGDRIRIILR